MDNTVKGFQTNEGTKQYDYNALANLPTLISQDNIDGAVASALEQAKQNGDFKGDKGDDYILTEADKVEIAEMAAELIDIPDNPGGNINLDGYATQQWVQDQNYLTSVPDNYVTSTELEGEVSSALAQAKQNGDFKGDSGDDYILTEADKQEIASMIQIPGLPDSPSSENKVLIIDASGDEIAYSGDEIIELVKQGYNISLYDGQLIYTLNYIVESNKFALFSSTSYLGNYLLYASIDVDSNGQLSKQQPTITQIFDLPPSGENVNHILKASSSGVDWVNFADEVVNIVTEKFTNVAEVGA